MIKNCLSTSGSIILIALASLSLLVALYLFGLFGQLGGASYLLMVSRFILFRTSRGLEVI